MFIKQIVVILGILQISIDLLKSILKKISNLKFNLGDIALLNIRSISFDKRLNCHVFEFENNKLLDHYKLILAIFKTLKSIPEFNDNKDKVIIASVHFPTKIGDKKYFIHRNVGLNGDTTIEEYLNKIDSQLNKFYESGYEVHTFTHITIKMWEIGSDQKLTPKIKKQSNPIHIQKRGIHTDIIKSKKTKDKNIIAPLKTPKTIHPKNIYTMDIETMNINNIQTPIAISFAYKSDQNIKTIFKLIDINKLKVNPTLAVSEMWQAFIKDLLEIKSNSLTIYSHNLGAFDGYFLYKGLLNLPGVNIDNISSIIDDQRKFISIEAKFEEKKLVWKDSIRVFPLSLNELCKMFGIEGKTSKYLPEFNSIDLFDKPELLKIFIDYSIQDSVALLNALNKAQEIYITKYKVDFTSVWSTSTLSLKIFRQLFQKEDIPIFNYYPEREIRKSYFGGSTDYYMRYGEGLYHYDVNSLYPHAMTKPMPLKFIRYIEGSEIDLNNFFGFCEVKVKAPDNIKIPLLPFKLEGKTLHPLGEWIGVYFSEELKAVLKYGYNFEVLHGYEFSKSYPFTDYVNHFFEEKRVTEGSEKFIAKMHLNQLYGYFGRKQELIETKNIKREELTSYLNKHSITAIIEINDEIITILMSSNLDFDIINTLNTKYSLNIDSNFKKVKSNVALASAVTSYGRIGMIKYKTMPGYEVYYTDTDSIFVNKPLPTEMIGDGLGQMKDELKGDVISKGYFLGIKKYCYIVNGETKSVFSGVKRNSLTLSEVETLLKGGVIVKEISTRFYKHFTDFSINIEQTSLSIKDTNDKEIINRK